MKALLTIEYLVSFIAFIGLVVAVYLLYSANIPTFIEEVTYENVRSKAYQLSEVLINDPGYPTNWGDPMISIDRIGLSDENFNKANLISKSKIDRLGDECTNNFQNVQKWLSLDQPFSIHVFNISQDPANAGERESILACVSPDLTKTAINITLKRIVAYTDGNDRKLGELIVQM